jgi:hypothetical protein
MLQFLREYAMYAFYGLLRTKSTLMHEKLDRHDLSRYNEREKVVCGSVICKQAATS